MERVKPDALPLHLALIPDGNRRWALANRISLLNTYYRSADHLCKFAIEWCFEEYDIKYVTIYGMSTENYFRRSKEWKRKVFEVTTYLADKIAGDEKVHSKRVSVRMIGERTLLPTNVLESIVNVERLTATYDDFHLTFAFAFSGRDEIVRLVETIAHKIHKSEISFPVSRCVVENNLVSSFLPDIDILIRPGENRISNFLLWKLAYSEMYFLKKPFLDFSKCDLDLMLKDFAKSERRFGE